MLRYFNNGLIDHVEVTTLYSDMSETNEHFCIVYLLLKIYVINGPQLSTLDQILLYI